MVNRLKSILLTLSGVIVFALTAIAPASAAAIDCTTASGASNTATSGTINQCLCTGSNINAAGDCSNQSDTVSKLVSTIINVLSWIIGAIAVIMIIYGGFRYVTSAGNAEGAKGARNTILYAVIGLVIVAVAQVIVHFVINTTTNATSGS